jgi:hypothetical protein
MQRNINIVIQDTCTLSSSPNKYITIYTPIYLFGCIYIYEVDCTLATLKSNPLSANCICFNPLFYCISLVPFPYLVL